MIWDRVDPGRAPRAPSSGRTGGPPGSATHCARPGTRPGSTELTGLRLDPYFTGTKLTWLAGEEPAIWAGLADGSLAAGTVDSYLIARLTGGRRRHVTDASNASRTLLFDITAGRWSAELCELLRVPAAGAARGGAVHRRSPRRTDPAAFLGLDLPIAGIAGDQQAALFGQACFAPGDAKCTYGTGSFVLVNTGGSVARPGNGLLSTVAWMDGSGALTYALEGSVFVTGAAVQWLRDGLGLLDDAAQSEALARRVPGHRRGGVRAGPDRARGAGLGSRRAGRDIRHHPGHDPGAPGPRHAGGDRLRGAGRVRRDGHRGPRGACGRCGRTAAASANDLLMQMQADQLQVPVERPEVGGDDRAGRGVPRRAGTGVWSSPAELAATWRLGQRFEPGARDDDGYARWRRAVERAKGWATANAGQRDRAAPPRAGSTGSVRVRTAPGLGWGPRPDWGTVRLRGGSWCAGRQRRASSPRCASSSTYSWPDRLITAYMISSVTARSTSRSDFRPAYREKSSGLPNLTPGRIDSRGSSRPGGWSSKVPIMAQGITGAPDSSASLATPVLPRYRRPSGVLVPSG